MDNFRPNDWNTLVGQQQLKNRLLTHIAGALEHSEPLPPILLSGPPGSGKTTVAGLIAKEMRYDYQTYITPPKKNVLKSIVREADGLIVLFDEIHRWSKNQQEDLLPLLEDGYLQMEDGNKIYSGDLTIIGATTEPDKLVAPLYDRFTIKPPFEEYSDEEMAKIVTLMAARIGVDFDQEAALILGRATGGVPRNGKAFVLMARDADTADPAEILRHLKITKDGLTQDHVNYLKVLKTSGGQAGLQIIAAHIQQPMAAILGLERLMLKRDLIAYESGGRVLTGPGFETLKQLKKLEAPKCALK